MNTFTSSNRLAARFVAVLAVFSLLMSMVPAQVLATANPGAIWTTAGDCGVDDQNLNVYNVGDTLYINGSNFTPEASLPWSITGKPGNASSDPNTVVANNSVIVGSDGSFCFEAYTVAADDDGEYGVDVDGKKDNYRVDGDTLPTTGKLTVVKNVTNDNGGTKVVADFPLFVNGTPVVSGASAEYAPGVYTVAETSSLGYAATFSGACDANGSVTLEAGDDKTCTITNDDVAPILGCTNSSALNYNDEANQDDGSCQYMCAYSDAGTTGNGAPSILTFVHPAWVDNLSSNVGKWIWSQDALENVTFTKAFFVTGTPTGGTLRIAADNTYQVSLNGNPLSCDGTGTGNFAAEETCSAPISSGLNILTVVASNAGGPNTADLNNPAGLIFEVVSSGSSCVPVEDLGSITIEKVFAGDEWAFNFDGSKGGFTLSSGEDSKNFGDLVAGEYTFSEELPGENWLNPTIVCTAAQEGKVDYVVDGAGVSVDLSKGQDVTCTFTNVAPVCEMGDNLLVNGSFEEPIVTAHGGEWEIFAAVTGWTIDLLKSNGLELWKGIGIGASEGKQNAELDGEDATKITQVVSGLIPNATYELRYDFAARTADAADNNMNVLLDGVVAQNVTSANTAWTTYTQSFVATDGDIEVGFEDIGTPQDGGGTGTLLDNAVLCLVSKPRPEPTLTFDGYKYNDENDNGMIDEGEKTIEGWEFELLYDGVVIDTTTTDEDGKYQFVVELGDVAIDAFEVREVLPNENSGWELTAIYQYMYESSERVEVCAVPKFEQEEVLLRKPIVDGPRFEDESMRVTCDFLNHKEGRSSSSTGTRTNRGGRVAGDSTSTPAGQVLGEQISVVPLGAAAAGAGGAAPVEIPGASLAAAAFLARRK